MPHKQFGNKVTFRGRPDVKQGDNCNPQVIDAVFDKWMQRAVSTVQEYSEPITGKKLASVRTVIGVDPQGLYLDQVGELVEPEDGLAYFVEGFNIQGYRANIRAGIERACAWWVQDHFGEFIVADPSHCVVTKNRPI